MAAAELLPGVFGDVEAAAEDDSLLDFDLGNLTAYDTQPVELPKKGREAALVEVTRQNAAQLVSRLFSLPTTPSEAGPVVSGRRRHGQGAARGRPALPLPPLSLVAQFVCCVVCVLCCVVSIAQCLYVCMCYV